MGLTPEYFESVYAAADDPWGFAHRWYERRKRSVLLASLPRARFGDAFEPGCSTGELTVALANRCASVLAVDVAERALDQAGRRTADHANVVVERREVPADWPAGRAFDLIVVSEIGYYLGLSGLDSMLDLAVDALTPHGVLVTCHWRHPAADYPLTGDAVADRVAAAAARHALANLVSHVEEDFRLDVHGATGSVSVARADGVL